MSDYYNKYPNKKEIMELKARICGYEKANRDQGFLITSLRNEVAELKAENKEQSAELLKYVTGAVSYNEEIYQMGRELYGLHEMQEGAVRLLKEIDGHIGDCSTHNDSDYVGGLSDQVKEMISSIEK